jgi:hypothetical protein
VTLCAQVASASELGDDLYKQLDTKKKELEAVLGNRDTSSFSIQQLLRLKESKLNSKEAEVLALQKKLTAQTTMMDALEGEWLALQLLHASIASSCHDHNHVKQTELCMHRSLAFHTSQ